MLLRCSPLEHDKLWYSGYQNLLEVTKQIINESRSVVSDSLWPHGLYSLWNSPGQNAGVGSLSLLQGIFPTQGSNPGLPHCRWVLCQLSDKQSPVRRYGDIKKLCCFQLPRIPFAFFWIPSCSYIIIHSPNLFSYFFHIPCPSLQLWPCD